MSCNFPLSLVVSLSVFYTAYCLEPEMNSGERIGALQQTLEELRKTYNNVKTELNALERRRKKMRKKEKDRTQRSTQQAESTMS